MITHTFSNYFISLKPKVKIKYTQQLAVKIVMPMPFTCSEERYPYLTQCLSKVY